MEILKRLALKWRNSTGAKAFTAAAGFETLSWLSYYLPELKSAMLVVMAAAAVVLAFKDLRALFGLLLIETVIGGHGHLFSHAGVSVRMAIFGVLSLGWAVHALRGCSRILHFAHAHVSGPLLALIGAVALGLLRAWSEGVSPGAAFSDANGYAFILLVPIALDLFADRRSMAWLTKIFAGAVAWLATKSLLLLYLFSHAFPGLQLDVFRWQRKWWLTEITPMDGGLVRVFSASDVFLPIAVFVGALVVARYARKNAIAWTAVALCALVLSLSRSFWLGMAVALTFTVPAFLRVRLLSWKELGGYFARGFGMLFAAIALIGFLAFFPFPQRSSGLAALGAFGSRLLDGGDAAVSSRWNMLPPIREAIRKHPILGSGFGSTITYASDDPRVISLHPGGVLTTPSIEWQYLEIWMKMGLFGLLSVLWLWWRLGRFAWRALRQASPGDALLAAGLFQAFLAFILANVFTPYLNHPLGWMFLALVIAGLHAVQEHERPPYDKPPTITVLR